MFDASGLPAFPRLLACGFGPFPGVEVNPAQAVLGALATEGWAPPGVRLTTRILPTTWSGAVDAALQAADDAMAESVVLFGVAAEAHAIQIETRASNCADPDRMDAQGYCWPGRRLSPIGPEERFTALPTTQIARAVLDVGVACSESSDAGDYICNRTYWGVLTAGRPSTLFVHLPMPAETAAVLALPCPSGLAMADLVAASKAVLAAVATGLSSARAPLQIARA